LQAKAAALKQAKEFNAAKQFCCCSSFYSDLVTSSLALHWLAADPQSVVLPSEALVC
jgi:hypothetical protein